MILYHATPLLKGKKILKDKRIKKNIERYHQDSKMVASRIMCKSISLVKQISS